MSIPTINKLLNCKFINKVVICSHLGRPKYREPELSLNNRVLKELEMKIERKLNSLIMIEV